MCKEPEVGESDPGTGRVLCKKHKASESKRFAFEFWGHHSKGTGLQASCLTFQCLNCSAYNTEIKICLSWGVCVS